MPGRPFGESAQGDGRMSEDRLLFGGVSAIQFHTQQATAMQDEIAGLDDDRLLNTNVDDLITYLVGKYSVDVPTLDVGGMEADPEEVQIDLSQPPYRLFPMGEIQSQPNNVSGTRITVHVPFSGDATLFDVQVVVMDIGLPFALKPLRGYVLKHVQTLIFMHEGVDLKRDQVKAAIDDWLNEMKRYLELHKRTFGQFNASLATIAREVVNGRRTKLLGARNLVASLGIPLRRRADAPATYTVPEVRRKIVPKLPPATSGSYKSEPALEMAEYEHILDVIQSMAKVMERSPTEFQMIEEGGLRSHFLVQLNGHYEGQATAETFNAAGKTDILIRLGDRNIFIAECKFWGGPATLTAAIDQLLSYLSWRDSKAAILLFNRNKDFSKVLAQIPPTVTAHPKFRNELPMSGETAYRCVLRHKDDDAKDITLTILAFDVPRPA